MTLSELRAIPVSVVKSWQTAARELVALEDEVERLKAREVTLLTENNAELERRRQAERERDQWKHIVLADIRPADRERANGR